MRLHYLSQSYVPSRRASSIQVINTCAAWARQSHDVTLVTKLCPPRQEPGIDDIFAFYGVAAELTWTPLSRPAVRGGGLLYRYCLNRHVRAHRDETDLFYCRDADGAASAARAEVPFAFEAHQPPGSGTLGRRQKRFLSAPSCRGLVTITESLAHAYRRCGGLPSSLPVVVAPDAASLDPPGGPPPRSLKAAPRPRVGYVGQLYPGKGLELLVALAANLPEASFHVVGGDPSKLARLARAALPENLTLHGFVSPAEVRRYYAELDVVLLPYGRRVAGATGRSDLAPWMSPLKMFEAMAAGRAIVAADLPALREVLDHEKTALLAEPEQLAEWIASVRRLLAETDLAARLGAAARQLVAESYTWDLRARRILRELGFETRSGSS